MKWYIKERYTAQVHYFTKLGKLSIKEAKKHQKPLVGVNILHKYETEKEYIDACIRNCCK